MAVVCHNHKPTHGTLAKDTRTYTRARARLQNLRHFYSDAKLERIQKTKPQNHDPKQTHYVNTMN